MSAGISKIRPYHLKVKPCQVWLMRDWVSLNPNRIITPIGRTSQTMISQV